MRPNPSRRPNRHRQRKPNPAPANRSPPSPWLPHPPQPNRSHRSPQPRADRAKKIVGPEGRRPPIPVHPTSRRWPTPQVKLSRPHPWPQDASGLRLADVDHPRDAEAVVAHAELIAPDLCLQRDRHGASVAQLLPVAAQLFGIVAVPQIYFDERIAARYDADAASEAGRRGDRGDDRRLRDDAGRRNVPAGLPRLQHDHEPDDPGRAGRVLPQRRLTPRARRTIRRRGRRARSAAPPARRDHPGVRCQPVVCRLRRVHRHGAQVLYSHHWWVTGDGAEVFSAPYRYVWPSELDLMARIAGMTLRERWSGWARAPFTSESTSHVSVWTKTA